MTAGGHLSPGHPVPFTEPGIVPFLPTFTQKQVQAPIVLSLERERVWGWATQQCNLHPVPSFCEPQVHRAPYWTLLREAAEGEGLGS